jgi:exopolysaccharide biosynthesis polyprenyl glycosylphosphotransferase
MTETSSHDGVPDFGLLGQEAFIQRLHWEQRRTERSRRPFALMLLESPALLREAGAKCACKRIAKALFDSIRETDIPGWYENASTLGIIFTELGSATGEPVGETLLAKIRDLLARKLTPQEIAQIKLSVFIFPDDWDKAARIGGKMATLYPRMAAGMHASHLIKRSIDIAGSLAAITLCTPVFLALAVFVRLSSKGPVLFRQKRIGQYGRSFTFLKFRSMYLENDPSIHEDYVKRLIAGTVPSEKKNGHPGVFKITDDPRITPVGRFLRKTSLDELPQFFNVLAGDMSLVGPRPPIPYEVECYDIWHRRRLLAVKPGITGLWQVTGRSRTTFDEMVRLDLQYAKSWSLWLDLKILLRTPRAVLVGDGAY